MNQIWTKGFADIAGQYATVFQTGALVSLAATGGSLTVPLELLDKLSTLANLDLLAITAKKANSDLITIVEVLKKIPSTAFSY